MQQGLPGMPDKRLRVVVERVISKGCHGSERRGAGCCSRLEPYNTCYQHLFEFCRTDLHGLLSFSADVGYMRPACELVHGGFIECSQA